MARRHGTLCIKYNVQITHNLIWKKVSNTGDHESFPNGACSKNGYYYKNVNVSEPTKRPQIKVATVQSVEILKFLPHLFFGGRELATDMNVIQFVRFTWLFVGGAQV